MFRDLLGYGLRRMHAGPARDAKTSRAQPPTSANKMTFASATTAGGSEIAQDLLLGHTSSLPLSSDLAGQPKEDLAAHVGGELGRVPRQEEARRPASARDEDDVVGAGHLARSVPEVADGYDAHVITLLAR